MREFALYGLDLFGNPIQPPASGPLAEKFGYPPFSVLNAREGEWQDRKAAWIALGLQSEVGRKKNLLGTGAGNSPAQAADLAVRYGLAEAALADGGQGIYGSSTSIFDPVLTELCYRWFCPPSGSILDPFAGGSVRGVVAGLLGYSYVGCDLRAEQVAANQAQAAAICPDAPVSWATADCLVWLQGGAPRWSDFVFTCPPYGDLEQYSDDPRDLSAMAYPQFLEAWAAVLYWSAFRLKPNRFLGVVVGDFRDPAGFYRGFVADTIVAARQADLKLYNDAILVTSAGTLPMRVSGQFDGSRKLGKTHQNLLIFAKGTPTWMDT